MTALVGYGLYLLPGVGQLVWAARLRDLRLLSRYPSLALYLLFSILSSAVVLSAHVYHADSEAYGWLFVVAQPVGWTLLLCVVLEVYQRMIDGYDGLHRFGRLMMYGAVGTLAVVLTFLLLLDKPDGALGQWRNFWYRQERSVYFGLCLLSVLSRRFSEPIFSCALERTLLSCLPFSGALFAGQALVLIVAEHFGGLVQWKNVVLPLLHGSCLLGGAVAFSRRGEEIRAGERVLSAQGVPNRSGLGGEAGGFEQGAAKGVKSHDDCIGIVPRFSWLSHCSHGESSGVSAGEPSARTARRCRC